MSRVTVTKDAKQKVYTAEVTGDKPLRMKFTQDLVDDLKNIHGLSAVDELTLILVEDQQIEDESLVKEIRVAMTEVVTSPWKD